MVVPRLALVLRSAKRLIVCYLEKNNSIRIHHLVHNKVKSRCHSPPTVKALVVVSCSLFHPDLRHLVLLRPAKTKRPFSQIDFSQQKPSPLYKSITKTLVDFKSIESSILIFPSMEVVSLTKCGFNSSTSCTLVVLSLIRKFSLLLESQVHLLLTLKLISKVLFPLQRNLNSVIQFQALLSSGIWTCPIKHNPPPVYRSRLALLGRKVATGQSL